MSILESLLSPEALKIMRAEEQELIDKSKTYEELIVEIGGVVLSVNGFNVAMNHTPESEIRIGGSSPSYTTGYQSRLEISLKLDTYPHPEKRIVFHGNSPVFQRDIVRMGVYLGEEIDLKFASEDKRVKKREERYSGLHSHFVLFPREIGEKEEALYIKILGEAGKVRRTDFGVNYRKKE